ncbi:MAG: hypothetical protein A4E58_00435 [Syntrophorhabdus sp. PtaB.Bin006]|nr:MAG: hypothetical protein A4E58_00435 [Syntrophorhabdus sp. PtaB.Bin006]
MTMFQAEMDFDGLRRAMVPLPGGVPTSYIEDRAVPQATKQGPKDTRPYNDGGRKFGAPFNRQGQRERQCIMRKRNDKGGPIRLVVY